MYENVELLARAPTLSSDTQNNIERSCLPTPNTTRFRNQRRFFVHTLSHSPRFIIKFAKLNAQEKEAPAKTKKNRFDERIKLFVSVFFVFV